MIRKIIAITIAIMMAMPQQAQALRPALLAGLVCAEQAKRAALRPMAMEISTKQIPHIGPATAALRIINAFFPENLKTKKDINIMMTYKCPFACEICLSEDVRKRGKNKDANKQMLYDIFDAYAGFEKAHLVGPGETTAYGKNPDDLLSPNVSQDFLDIVRYAASRIKEVRIVTNGYLIPEDVEKAKEFFAQFPPNTVWVLSVNYWIEAQTATIKNEKGEPKSLRRVIKTMEQLAEEGIIKTAYNVRLFDFSEKERVLARFGLTEKVKKDRDNVFINRIQRQGGARFMGNARRIIPEDVVEHSYAPEMFYGFIDPEGNFTTSDHVAYETFWQRLRRLHYFYDVLGSVKRRPLADMLLDKLLFKNFLVYIDKNYQYYFSKKYRHITKTICKAICIYFEGDKNKAKALIKSLNLDDEITKETVMDMLYMLFLRMDNIDLRPFIGDCFEFKSFSNILDILHTGIATRRKFEEALFRYTSLLHRMPRRWIKDSFSGTNLQCPVYEVRSAEDYHYVYRYDYDYKDKCSVLGDGDVVFRPVSQREIAEKKFFNLFKAASMGLASYPLGILHSLSDDKWYFIEEHVSDYAELAIIYVSVSERREFSKLGGIFESLGRFAAQLDNANVRINPEGFDLLSVRRRNTGEWVLVNCQVSYDGKTYSSAKDLLLQLAIQPAQRYLFQTIKVESESNALVADIQERFRQGYSKEALRLGMPKIIYLQAISQSALRPMAMKITIKSHPWRFEPQILFYPAANIDLDTVVRFLRKFPSITHVVLTDSAYNISLSDSLTETYGWHGSLSSVLKKSRNIHVISSNVAAATSAEIAGKGQMKLLVCIADIPGRKITIQFLEHNILDDKMPDFSDNKVLYLVHEPGEDGVLGYNASFMSRLISHMKTGDYLCVDGFKSRAWLPFIFFCPELYGIKEIERTASFFVADEAYVRGVILFEKIEQIPEEDLINIKRADSMFLDLIHPRSIFVQSEPKEDLGFFRVFIERLTDEQKWNIIQAFEEGHYLNYIDPKLKQFLLNGLKKFLGFSHVQNRKKRPLMWLLALLKPKSEIGQLYRLGLTLSEYRDLMGSRFNFAGSGPTDLADCECEVTAFAQSA